VKSSRLFIYALILAICIAVGGFLKKKYYDPKRKLSAANEQVSQLTAKGAIRDGDVIFQTSLSTQSKAIQIATHSKYSHCGIIFSFDTGNAKYYVIEAEGRVKWTPLTKWIARGEDGHYVIKRMVTDPMIPDEMLTRLKQICEGYLGKKYDPYFEWSDDRIYCSELVWKAYYKLNKFELGKPQQLKDFDLSNDMVKAKLAERYGDKIPLNDTVISPAAIFDSNMLKTVAENN